MNHKPHLIEKYEDKKLGYKYYFVIDSFRGFNKCCGGIRILPDVKLQEIKDLARGMTLKYSFLNFQSLGGAKSGLKIPKNCDEKLRKKILISFADHMGKYIKTEVYHPGTDIGSCIDDLKIIFDRNGINTIFEDTSYYTALTVLQSGLSAIKELNIEKNDLTCSIEGFGNVGNNLAKEIRLRYPNLKIISVSTIYGGIYNKSGLNIKLLNLLKEKYNSKLVNNYSHAKKIKKEDLLKVKCDILFLCGRSRAITKDIIKNLDCKIICPASNFPLDTGLEKRLHQKGIIYIPDFVANSGGVSLSSLHSNGATIGQIKKFVKSNFSNVVKKLISVSLKRNTYPYKIAYNIAEHNFKNNIKNKKSLENTEIKKNIAKITPKRTLGSYHMYKIKRSMKNILKYLDNYR